MTKSDFAERHGFQAPRPDFEERDYLPEEVRKRAGEMLVKHLQYLAATTHGRNVAHKNGPRLFVVVVRETLDGTPGLWKWHESVHQRVGEYTKVANWSNNPWMCRNLLQPLMDCEWAWFYTVVENACKMLDSTRTGRVRSLASELNLLLKSQRIPWKLQSGLVIPADEYEFADELEYVTQYDASATAQEATDPRVTLKKAFAALFRKQGGPDIVSVCLHAWSAWETAREAAGGINLVQQTYPELWESITAWQRLIHAGRHPGKNLGRLPTEKEARFIVGLLTNAVRLVSTPAVADNAT